MSNNANVYAFSHRHHTTSRCLHHHQWTHHIKCQSSPVFEDNACVKDEQVLQPSPWINHAVLLWLTQLLFKKWTEQKSWTTSLETRSLFVQQIAIAAEHQPTMGCASSTKCIEELYSMSFITDEAGQVPMPIVKPFVIRGTVQFKLRSNSSNNSSNEKQKRNSQIIQKESSRVILPSYSRIRIKAVGSTTIVYGNARFIWDDKLGLQTSR